MVVAEGNEHKFVGAGFAVVAAAVPDWVMGAGEKVLVAVVVAFLSGFAYAAGRGLWNRVSRTKKEE